MKKIKIIIIIFLMFFLSGCSANYNLKINFNQKVDENIEVKQELGVIKMYYESEIEQYYRDMYKTYKDQYKFSDYNIKINDSVASSGIILDKTYQTIDEFLKSNHLKILFNDINVQNYNNEYIIKLSDYNDLFNDIEDPHYSLEPFSISLNSDLIIKNTNADKKNILTGKYSWDFDKTIEDKTIEFTLTKKQNYFTIIFNNKALFYGILVIIIILIGFIIYGVVNNKLKKVNQI